MTGENTDDAFIVTWSQWKVWTYAILCWVLAALFMLPLSLYVYATVATGYDIHPEFLLILLLVTPIILFFATIPLVPLNRRNKPIATLNRYGFTGLTKLFRVKSFRWQQNTKPVYYGKMTTLTNPNAQQSLWSRILWGYSDAATVHNILAKESRADVERAVKRFSKTYEDT